MKKKEILKANKLLAKEVLRLKLQETALVEDVEVFVDFKNDIAFRYMFGAYHFTELTVANLVEATRPRWYLVPKEQLSIVEKVVNKAKHVIKIESIMNKTKIVPLGVGAINGNNSFIQAEQGSIQASTIKLNATETQSVEPEVKKAACVLVQEGSLFLMVSRKDSPKDFGLPGGKAEPNETPCQTAIRETLEETGYTVILDTNKVFKQVDANGYEVTTFVAKIDTSVPPKGIKASETGEVRLKKREALLEGSFGEYNKQLLEWFDGLPK